MPVHCILGLAEEGTGYPLGQPVKVATESYIDGQGDDAKPNTVR